MAKNKNDWKANEDDWRARDDARTLIEAKKIKNDPARLKKAVKAAKIILHEKSEEARAAKAIAGLFKD
jgi:hypothetical protein